VSATWGKIEANNAKSIIKAEEVRKTVLFNLLVNNNPLFI
jgi:hypothetical protein